MSVPRSPRLAIVIESRDLSFCVGGRSLVYGWWPQALARKEPNLVNSEQERALAARPVRLWPWALTHSSSRKNFPGRMGERRPCALVPSGAVSPTRTTSRPWPVASSARRPAKNSWRYMTGDHGMTFFAVLENWYCGASQPAWLGSFHSPQKATRGSTLPPVSSSLYVPE